jgi:cytochrome b
LIPRRSRDSLRAVLVWDWPTRLFHWVLAAAIGFEWWTYRVDQMHWHKLCGFLIIALVIFRLCWGFAGASTARFSNFVRGPSHVLRYVRGELPAGLGHNPLGGWSVLALLSLVLVVSGLGLFSVDQDYLEPGPLSFYVQAAQAVRATQLHRLSFYALLAVIAVHVTAVLIYELSGTRLIPPMISGRKRVQGNIPPVRPASAWAFAAAAALSAAVFLLLLELNALQ